MRPSAPSAGRTMQLRPAKSPDNSFVFGNICAVSAQDIPPSHDGKSAKVSDSVHSGLFSYRSPPRTTEECIANAV